MTKVIIAEDCGNSPKNTFVQELTVAFAKGDLTSIIKRISDDFIWTLVGSETITGQENVVEWVGKSEKTALLQIDHIATHGKTGVVDGTLHLASGKTLAFCDVYEFANAKGESVKAIKSYRIELQ